MGTGGRDGVSPGIIFHFSQHIWNKPKTIWYHLIDLSELFQNIIIKLNNFVVIMHFLRKFPGNVGGDGVRPEYFSHFSQHIWNKPKTIWYHLIDLSELFHNIIIILNSFVVIMHLLRKKCFFSDKISTISGYLVKNSNNLV